MSIIYEIVEIHLVGGSIDISGKETVLSKTSYFFSNPNLMRLRERLSQEKWNFTHISNSNFHFFPLSLRMISKEQ